MFMFNFVFVGSGNDFEVRGKNLAHSATWRNGLGSLNGLVLRLTSP